MASSYGADSETETLTCANSPTNRDTDMRELAHEQVIAVMLRLPDVGLIVEQACGALQVSSSSFSSSSSSCRADSQTGLQASLVPCLSPWGSAGMRNCRALLPHSRSLLPHNRSLLNLSEVSFTLRNSRALLLLGKSLLH